MSIPSSNSMADVREFWCDELVGEPNLYPHPLPKAAGVGSNLMLWQEQDGFQDGFMCTFVPITTGEVFESLEELCGFVFTRFIHFLALLSPNFKRPLLLGKHTIILKTYK